MGKKPQWNEIRCPHCKEPMKVSATKCPHCTTEFSPEVVAARVKENKQSTMMGCGVLIVGALALSMCVGGSDENATSSTPETVSLQPSTADSSVSKVTPPPSPSDSLTGPQRNAVRSAQSYLAMTGFSRQGLIEQLSSDAGDGYSVADATAAVDSLTVDWNEQAARSAKNYIDMMGFSCNGLIDQLSSDAGDGYTRAQAQFGAKQVGAC